MKVRAILLDIEGTTSSIAFVHETLFPYAARALPAFVRQRSQQPEVATLLDEVRAEAGEADAGIDRVIEILGEWIAEDRKVTPLKTLQGMIWKKGYENGELRGHVYADAVTNMRKWAKAGIGLSIYSSGSVDAQRLLFGHSEAGDLRSLISEYFDTRIGGKREASSYRRISRTLAIRGEDILFLSDVAEELDAAAQAGMRTVQLVRDERVIPGAHKTVADFDSVPVSLTP